MIAELLPQDVASAEAFADTDSSVLFADEESVVACAVEGRRRAFTTGRVCARRALAGLGLEPVAILTDKHGAPCWPYGVVGSITHCEGYRASAVAWEREVLCVGIDAEPNGALSERVLQRVALTQEQAWIREFTADSPVVSWGRLLFSAKEAVIKAWYPLTGRLLDFTEIVITFAGGAFDARLLLPGPVVAGHHLAGYGRWLVRDGLVATAVVVPVGSDSSRV